jgi:hypothetical protein
MNPTPLRALDLSRRGKTILVRLVTDQGHFDVSLTRTHAATMGNALADYAEAV